MAQLINRKTQDIVIQDLKIADSFKTRAIGLIGTRSLSNQEGVWFPKSNWIHTLFMSMAIDVIYLDKNHKVHKLQPNLKPWRFPAPVLGARSVVETSSGFIENSGIKLGDSLDVGH